MPTLSEKTKTFFKYFLMVIVVFSTDTYITFSNLNVTVKKIFQFALILSAAIMFFISFGKGKRSSRLIKAFLVMSFFIGISMIINRDFSKSMLFKVIVVFFGASYVSVFSFKDFRLCYVRMMKIVAIYSIAVLALSPLILKIPFLPHINNGYSEVVFCGLTNLASGTARWRNWGPFWEPGVYQIYLCLALLFTLYDNNSKLFTTIVFTLAIISTLSTSGIICLIVIFVSYLLSGEKTLSFGYARLNIQKKAYLYFFGFLSILIFLYACYSFNLLAVIFEKLSPSSERFESTQSRLYSTYADFYIFMHHPLGVGSVKLSDAFDEYMLMKGITVYSNSNGLITNFAMFGIGFGIIYVVLLYKLSLYFTKNKFSNTIIFLVFILMLFSEPLQHSAIFNTIIFYGAVRQSNPNKKTKNFCMVYRG